MKSSWKKLAVFFILPLFFNGCALFVLGAGAAGGYAISRDEIEGFSDKSADAVWSSALEVLTGQGAILLQDKQTGHLEAKVGGSEVKIEIFQVTPKSVRMRVQARKGYNLFPDMKLAQRIYTLLVNELKG
ncbi:MAG TPA: hypothetical protein VL688_00065 [Verrucomicrobiae bacterium]|nr:hypothetical protein [Verrucomicrobiae bacterium]